MLVAPSFVCRSLRQFVTLIPLALVFTACGSSEPSSQSLGISADSYSKDLASLTDTQRSLGEPFPMTPNPELTPGKLCDKPDSYRYPEQIAYCDRNVSTSEKWRIIREYDERLGHHIQDIGRQDFKIDHFIPLCFGGGNDAENLWPQHKSVYVRTDPLEHELCEKLSRGAIPQKKAIEIIIKAKTVLDEVESMRYLIASY